MRKKLLRVIYNKKIEGLDFKALEEKLQEVWLKERGDMLVELSISFVDMDEMVELNRSYRGKDRPTDVLSFSMLEGVEQPQPVDMKYRCIGDVVVCPEVAKRQAVEFGTTFQQEVEKLIIHGLLHILGYEHEDVNEEEARKMREKEERYLRL